MKYQRQSKRMYNNKYNAHAVVMGLSVAGLSVARALGRRGIKVIGVSPLSLITSRRQYATYSRFMTHVQEPMTDSESERLNFFVGLGQKLEFRAVILPTGDRNVMFLSQNRDILEKYFHFILPSHELLKSITSKLGLIDIAQRYQIPLPSSLRINTISDLKNVPSEFFPCVFKPKTQDAWLTKDAIKVKIFGLKAIPVMNKSELREKYNL